MPIESAGKDVVWWPGDTGRGGGDWMRSSKQVKDLQPVPLNTQEVCGNWREVELVTELSRIPVV